jgi:2-aminophenol/2-amino-5-chlorophenol 1,6-dioxygenase beta subunit
LGESQSTKGNINRQIAGFNKELEFSITPNIQAIKKPADNGIITGHNGIESHFILHGKHTHSINAVKIFKRLIHIAVVITKVMEKGQVVLGCLAPHPPHLVYAENPEQNEPFSEGGWETLRWGYNRLARKLKKLDYDVMVIFTPHWATYIGTHFLGLPKFNSLSVDPIFPNIFRYKYDLTVDVELAQEMQKSASDAGIITKMMTNPDFRIDYGTITSCHMLNPEWDKPIITISSNRNTHYYSGEVMNEQAKALGEACLKAIEKSGKKVVLVSSHSLSHRHFVTESPLPEDMSREHIYNHSQYVWDMKMIKMMREGKMKEVIDIMPEYTEQTIAETEAGGLTWMMAAMGIPNYPAEIYGYQSVIGTGNAVVAWDPNSQTREIVL